MKIRYKGMRFQREITEDKIYIIIFIKARGSKKSMEMRILSNIKGVA